MAIITPPAPLPLRGAKWRLPPSAQVNKSAWTGTSKTVGLPGAQNWTVTAAFVTQIGQDRARRWRGFFVQVSQPYQRFPVGAVEAPQTNAANPSVRAGAGNYNSLPLQGLPANQVVLLAGDLMTVPLPSGHQRLVCLSADLVSNGQGQCTAIFGPELGGSPAIGVVVEIREPFSLVRLVSDPPGWDVEPGQQYAFSITAEEAR